LRRAARLGLSGAMITEYPLEHRRYDGSEYEPDWMASGHSRFALAADASAASRHSSGTRASVDWKDRGR
jgi:hypothetical protein